MESPLLSFQQIDFNIASTAELWSTAKLCLKLGRINQSLTLAYSAVQKDQQSQQIYHHHYIQAIKLGAEFCEEIGDYQRGAYYWNLLTQQMPQNADAWYGLGISKANLEDYQGAEIAFNRTLELQPQNQKVHHHLIRIQALLHG